MRLGAAGPVTLGSQTAGLNNMLTSVQRILVSATSRETIDTARQEVNNLLLKTHGITDPTQADFLTTTQEQVLNTLDSTSATLTLLLAGVAGVSLLVGGIGVMNIMLVSVTERVGEIGLRKALGATRSDILRQFLIEAASLSAGGGVPGDVRLDEVRLVQIAAAQHARSGHPGRVGEDVLILHRAGEADAGGIAVDVVRQRGPDEPEAPRVADGGDDAGGVVVDAVGAESDRGSVLDADGRPVLRPRPDITGNQGASPFPPIADYAFLSDCEVTALIAPSGNVEWMCLPRMDSPCVFGAILDRGAGGFRMGPAGVNVPASRRYLPGTMILETSWEAEAGWAIVRDVLLIGPWHHREELSRTYRRSPTDYDADHVLLRTVRCVQGEVQLVFDCEPVFDYGRRRARWDYTDMGYHQGVARADTVDLELKLTTDMRIGFEGPRATARTLLKEGDTRFCALSWSEHQPPRTFDEAYRRLVWTAHHWQHWLARGNFPDHRWRSYLQRSALTLKGLTFAPTGALIAAATTSLPETPHGERNWDYRFSWIRDSTLALWALDFLGFGLPPFAWKSG